MAIETDCDARVVSLGYPLARYSETLIAVAQRHSASYAMTMVGYGSKSFLEQRINNMLRKKTRHAQVWALSLPCLGIGLAVCAAQVAPPKIDVVDKSSSKEIAVDRHRGQPEALGHRAHRERGEPALGGDRECRVENFRPAGLLELAHRASLRCRPGIYGVDRTAFG